MGSIALPALDVKQPESPMDSIIKAQQLRGLMMGQQLSAQELQQRNLQTQQLKISLQGEQRVLDAQQDPSWNPTDTDAAVKVLMKHSVPLEVAGRVIQGINQIRQGLSQQSSENLKAVQDAHGFFDDQFQAVRSAPEEKQQSVYQQSIANAVKYTDSLPDGRGKQQLLNEIAQAPALYDSSWINQQHAQLRSMQYLTEEALKTAQQREATGKGVQAQTEAALAAAKIPGAQAESTIQVQQAALGAQGRALAGNLPYQAAGGSPQANQALNLETQQKVQAAQAGVAGAPSALRGVAPHLVQAATAAFDKAGQEYAAAYQAGQNMSDFIQQARSGNKEAVRIVPLQGALEITTSQGVHRINRTEVDQFAGAGNAYDKLAGAIGGGVTGKNITDSVLNDMDAFQKTVSQNAATLHANKVATINASYGSKFEPMKFGQDQSSNMTKQTTSPPPEVIKSWPEGRHTLRNGQVWEKKADGTASQVGQ